MTVTSAEVQELGLVVSTVHNPHCFQSTSVRLPRPVAMAGSLSGSPKNVHLLALLIRLPFWSFRCRAGLLLDRGSAVGAVWMRSSSTSCCGAAAIRNR